MWKQVYGGLIVEKKILINPFLLCLLCHLNFLKLYYRYLCWKFPWLDPKVCPQKRDYTSMDIDPRENTANVKELRPGKSNFNNVTYNF